MLSLEVTTALPNKEPKTYWRFLSAPLRLDPAAEADHTSVTLASENAKEWRAGQGMRTSGWLPNAALVQRFPIADYFSRAPDDISPILKASFCRTRAMKSHSNGMPEYSAAHT
jgi:hypothetical protein